MVREIRARYSRGKIEPLDDVDFAEGEEFLLTIRERDKSTTAAREAIRETAGAWRGLVDADALKRDIAKSREGSRPGPPPL